MMRRFWHFTLLVFCMALMSGHALAQSLRNQPLTVQAPASKGAAIKAAAIPDYAYAAYQTGFYERSFTEAMARITRDNKDAAAMTLLGELFRQGLVRKSLGRQSDLTKAADWYRLAHERGDANASFALAMATLKGEGVARDPAQALRLLEAAAPRQPEAAYNLALIHLSSAEVAERVKAIPPLERAANAEIADAQYALGVLKKQGQDVALDITGAAELMRRAAQNGSEAAEIEYAIMLFNGQGMARDERKAADLFQKLAIRGNAIAQNRYARLLAAGRGRSQNAVEAVGWHFLAKQQGLADETLEHLFENFTTDDKTRALALAAKLASSNLASQNLTAPPPTGQ